jgi:GTP-binding protein HflX
MEKAILVGLELDRAADFDHSMEELYELAKACELEVAGQTSQRALAVNKAYYIGTGKVEEVRSMVKDTGADLVIFDNALSPMQLRNLNQALDVAVMDRTTLILEIFSRRARTREARLQVDVAALTYALPRLVGLHDALSRQGGTSGAMSNRGAGEKKLELDRRHIEARLGTLRRELEHVKLDRETQRKRRQKSSLPLVGLVGYTNAGKSSIMNGLIELYQAEEEKQVFEEDMLFATLETTVRRLSKEDGKSFLLSDTVGFISNLPHHLVQAFRSTLEEIKDADLLLEVVDYADPHAAEQMQVTADTLKDLGAGDIPVLRVYNKLDRCRELPDAMPYPMVRTDTVYISAKEEESLKLLAEEIEKRLFGSRQRCKLFLPYTEGGVLSALKEQAQVLDVAYEAEGISVTALLSDEQAGRYRAYLTDVEKHL